MTLSNYRLSKGDTILVTGANGYIASHIVDILLEKGYNVRGTVRTAKPTVNKLFDDKYGKERFETIEWSGIEEEGPLAKIMKGVFGVIHVATDTSLNPDHAAVLPRVIAGTVNVLKAAAKEPTVKSVVLTSSSSAALVTPPNTEGIVIDENTWNDDVVEAVRSGNMPPEMLPFMVYAASKCAGEQAFWKWVKENNPKFATNTIVPYLNIGQVLIPGGNASTMGLVRNLLHGDDTAVKLFPAQWYIDVRDVARVHVAALLDPTVSNQRLFAAAAAINWTDVLEILASLRPENKLLPKAPENEGRDLSKIPASTKTEDLIKSFFGVPGWTSFEDSIAAGIADLK